MVRKAGMKQAIKACRHIASRNLDQQTVPYNPTSRRIRDMVTSEPTCKHSSPYECDMPEVVRMQPATYNNTETRMRDNPQMRNEDSQIRPPHRTSKKAMSRAGRIAIWGILWILFAASPAWPQAPSATAANVGLTLSTDSVEPARFVAVHGRRSAILGYPENGLEIWAWPFQILSGYRIGIRSRGAATEIEGERLLRRIEYAPDAVTRIYIGPDFVLRERFFVPLDLPGAIITYKVEGRGHVDITVHFTPVLNLMWPASTRRPKHRME